MGTLCCQSIKLVEHPYATLGTKKLLTASTSSGDLDNDGDMDIVVANGRHWAEFNQVFFNDGNGFFRRSKFLSKEATASYATPLADLDNDGDLDIVVANDRTMNQVFFNDGKGNFSFGNSFGRQQSNTRGICLVDINKDGYVDAVEANRKSQNYLYINNGRGKFEKEIPFGKKDEATISIAANDMNSDGYTDLVLANRNAQPNRIYYGCLLYTSPSPRD